MDQGLHSIYSVGGLQIDASRLVVKRDGEELHVRSKTYQVLLFLLQNRQRLVTRNELADAVWPNIAVTDNALEQSLGEIRRLLGDNARDPRFVKTVRGAGYRFIGDVSETSVVMPDNASPKHAREAESSVLAPRRDRAARYRGVAVLCTILVLAAAALASFYVLRARSGSASALSTTLSQEPGRRSVAVMFFDNQSNSRDVDWLREGLADMMITDLSRSPNLAVLSREQLHALRERLGITDAKKVGLDECINIANTAQAKVLVLGTFVKLGDQIRIDVHLHDARDGQLLTADRAVIDRTDQIFTQVDLLSARIALYLGGTGAHESDHGLNVAATNNLEAYRYYSLGVEKAHALQTKEAIDLLKKAVALDPEFALAWARLGYTYAVTWGHLEEGKPYLEKAFQLSSRLTENDRLHIAAWYQIANQDYPEAIKSYRELISRYPLEVESYARLGMLLVGEERFDEALEIMRQGLVIDPGAKELYNRLGGAYGMLGRKDEAIEMFRRYVDLAPTEANAHDSLGSGYQTAGQYEDATAEYTRALELKPDFDIARVHLANTMFQQGRYREAEDQYRHYIRVAPSDGERSRGYACIAEIDRRMGRFDEAKRLGKQVFAQFHSGPDELIRISLDTNDIAGAEKFRQILESMPNSERGARYSLRPFFFYRGMIALRAGRTEEGIEDLKEALKRRSQPWNIDTLEDCLANAYVEIGAYDQAIAEYQRIRTLNPRYPLLDYHLAQAYKGKGDPAAARENYARFLEAWQNADTDIPEVVNATRYLSEHVP